MTELSCPTLRIAARRSRSLGLLFPLVGSILLAGCSKTQTPPPTVAPTETHSSPEHDPEKNTPPENTTLPATPSPPPSQSGPWLEDPLAELRKQGVEPHQLPLPQATVARTTTSEPPPAGDKPEPPPSQPDTPSEPANNSPLSIDVEIAQAAIKRATLRLRQNLQNATIYGTQYEEVQACAEELAILVILAPRSDSPPSWSRHAPALRDLAMEISLAARDLSPEAFKKAARAFESVEQLLQGNIPDGIPQGRPLDLPFSEFVQRAPVMRRLELSQKLLQSASAQEADFKQQLDLLSEEAVVAAVLMQTLTEPGFTGANEPEYQAHAKTLIQACLTAQSAAREKQFFDFQNAISALGKSCNDCHQDYRFNSE